ncbi:hypothetical protein [Pseudoalteromonas phage vB_PtuP_Slicky01]|nr:hypothetical protein [Pseudoalteromonas phage vB_PtuP_Slicky01]
MALSFGRALLAGAAGVAEYSNEEQQRRQERIDRTQQLRDNMEIEQAKSKYAVQYKSYERDQGVLKSLGSTDPNSVQGQMILMQAYNPGMEPALAFQMIQGGAKMKAPVKSDDIPVFDMPQFQRGGRAVSPIEDWFNGFTNAKTRNLERAQAEYSKFQLQLESEQATTQPESQAITIPTQSMGDYQPPGQETAGTLEPMGGADKVPQADFDRDLQQLGGFFAPKAKQPEYEIKWTTGSADNKAVDKAIIIDKNNPNAKPIVREFPTGEHSYVKAETYESVNPDGSVTYVEPYVSREDPTVSIVGREWVVDTEMSQGLNATTLKEEKFTPMKLATEEQYADYTFAGDDKRNAGMFYVDFDPTELKNLNKLDSEDLLGKSGWAAGNEIPTGFRESLAKNYLDVRNADIQAGNFYLEDLLSPRKKELEDLWKANAYLESFDDDDVLLRAIKAGAIPANIFDTPEGRELPYIQEFITKMKDEGIFMNYDDKDRYIKGEK